MELSVTGAGNESLLYTLEGYAADPDAGVWFKTPQACVVCKPRRLEPRGSMPHQRVKIVQPGI